MPEVISHEEGTEQKLPMAQVVQGLPGSKDGKGIGDLVDDETVGGWVRDYLAGRGETTDAGGLEPAFRYASALYMLYLAWKIATAPPLTEQTAMSLAPTLTAGFLLAIANPKAYVAIAAVFAGSILGPFVKTAILTAMIIVIHICWLFAGASLSRLLRDPRSSRAVNVGFALTLVGMTVLSLLR